MVEQLIPEARDLVARILEEDPRRLQHCAGVAARALALVTTVPPSAADTLVAAAWMHDIGYAPRVMMLDERLRDKLKRHGPETPNARANPERDDYIRAAARRVADRLAAVGQRDTELERAGEQPGDHP